MVNGPDVHSSCGQGRRYRLIIGETYLVGVGGPCGPISAWSTLDSYSETELGKLRELRGGDVGLVGTVPVPPPSQSQTPSLPIDTSVPPSMTPPPSQSQTPSLPIDTSVPPSMTPPPSQSQAPSLPIDTLVPPYMTGKSMTEKLEIMTLVLSLLLILLTVVAVWTIEHWLDI